MNVPAYWYFFTAWQLCLLILASFTPFDWISRVINLPFLSLYVFFAGLYISWIRPRAYYIPIMGLDLHRKSTDIIQSWPERLLIDLSFHIVPLVYALKRFGPIRFTVKSTIGTVMILGVYLLCFSVKDTYKISLGEMVGLLGWTVLVSTMTR